MNVLDAANKVLAEDPRTRDTEYAWLFLVKVLKEMGFQIFLEFDGSMPSPETLFRARRDIMNKKNSYGKSESLGENVRIERPGRNFNG